VLAGNIGIITEHRRNDSGVWDNLQGLLNLQLKLHLTIKDIKLEILKYILHIFIVVKIYFCLHFNVSTY